MNKFLSTLLGNALVLMGSAYAAPITTPISNSLWVMNDETQQVAISSTPAGNANTTPQPSWAVAQWYPGYQLGFPYPQTVQSNGNWNLANSSASVTYDNTTEPWLNGVYRLAQNGINIPCYSPVPGGEYDLLLIPKSPEVTFGPKAANAPYGLTSNPLLSNLNSLSFNVGVKINYENIGSNCNINQTSYLLGLMFKNISNNEIMFYQLSFRAARRVNNSIVQMIGNGDIAYDAGNHLIIDDHITSVAPGLSAPVPGGQRVAYGVDILPRLRAILQSGGSGNNKFDTNLSHYKLINLYIGSAVFGNTQTDVSIDNFRVLTTP